jgi:5-methyltetrahydrofolate--homocysteine methyltransferase
MDEILQKIFDGILEGDRGTVRTNVQKAIDAKMAPATILNDGMIAAMGKVGKLFEEGEYYVPEMLIAARAMKEGLELIKPLLKDANIQSAGKVAAGTVRGDLHDIGKNLVCMMLEGAGFEIIDLGTDVTPEKFVEAVREKDANLIAMSALLTTTMPNMRTTIDALNASGLRDKVKIMVGGAPVTESYAHQIGADGYATDASRAVALAKSLVG